jgi:hypothetical protein
MEKEFQGIPALEIIKLIDTRKKRYCAITLGDIEEIIKDKDQLSKIRKIVLDNFNNYTRSVYSVAGIDIEGAST